MKAIFADTFYFLAIVSHDDAAHARAVALSSRLTAPIVTTAWVLTETADALAVPRQRPIFRTLFDSLRNDVQVNIVSATYTLFEQGIALFNARPDKSWSLTDCISFVVMQQMQLTDALTGDHHFEQAGFRTLLA